MLQFLRVYKILTLQASDEMIVTWQLGLAARNDAIGFIRMFENVGIDVILISPVRGPSRPGVALPDPPKDHWSYMRPLAGLRRVRLGVALGIADEYSRAKFTFQSLDMYVLNVVKLSRIVPQIMIEQGEGSFVSITFDERGRAARLIQ